MANPSPVSYSSPVPKVGGGRERFPNALLDLIAATPEGGWLKINNNNFFSGAVPSDAYIPTQSTASQSWKVIGAWSSIGWDSKRHKFYLFGGGHANTADSTLYQFDAVTGLWSIAYYSPETEVVVGSTPPATRCVGGTLNAPVSAHTYCNNNYLPVLDRFYHPGGANVGAGDQHKVFNPDGSTARALSGYIAQLPLAGAGFVGGLPGSNPVRLGAPRLPGARAWTALDYGGVGVVNNPTSFISCASDVAVENGVDVVYQMHRSGTSKRLTKIVMPSLDISTHVCTLEGITWSYGVDSDATGALDRDKQAFLIVGSNWGFWDLKSTRVNNRLQEPIFDASAALTQIQTEALSVRGNYGTVGMAADPIRGGLVIWGHGARVYRVTPPAGSPTPATGWTIEFLNDGSSAAPRPMTYEEHVASGYVTNGTIASGTLGKWRYASDLDCFVGMQGWYAGDVWLWKPIGWQDPRNAA